MMVRRSQTAIASSTVLVGDTIPGLDRHGDHGGDDDEDHGGGDDEDHGGGGGDEDHGCCGGDEDHGSGDVASDRIHFPPQNMIITTYHYTIHIMMITLHAPGTTLQQEPKGPDPGRG